ncbi:MAG: two pore domain potassium channel family protein [Polaromonas sp.]
MAAIVGQHGTIISTSLHQTHGLSCPPKNQKKVHLARRGVIYSLILCGVILPLGGAGFWLLDPGVHTLADGLWLATASLAAIFVEKNVAQGEELQIEHKLMREIRHLREEVQLLRHEIQPENSSGPY